MGNHLDTFTIETGDPKASFELLQFGWGQVNKC